MRKEHGFETDKGLISISGNFLFDAAGTVIFFRAGNIPDRVTLVFLTKMMERVTNR